MSDKNIADITDRVQALELSFGALDNQVVALHKTVNEILIVLPAQKYSKLQNISALGVGAIIGLFILYVFI